MNNYKGTPFQRSLVEYESYITDERHAKFFDRQYLEGLAEQRRFVSNQFGRFFVAVIVSSILLISYSAGLEMNWNIGTVALQEIQGGLEILIFLCSMSLLAFTVRMLDFFMVDQMISRLIIRNLWVQSPKFFYAHIDSTNIATEILSPKTFGFSTGRRLRILSAFMAYGFFALPVAGFLVGVFAIMFGSIQAYSEPSKHWVFYVLTIAGDTMLLLVISKIIVGVFLKFNFPIAEYKQSSGRDTEN